MALAFKVSINSSFRNQTVWFAEQKEAKEAFDKLFTESANGMIQRASIVRKEKPDYIRLGFPD